jgi:hypothetical protein
MSDEITVQIRLDALLTKVSWQEFCEVTGVSFWARAEGQMEDSDWIGLTTRNARKLEIL